MAVGWRNRWLNAEELLLTGGLLLIPYWLIGYEIQMVAMARYVSVIVPLYPVLGRLLARLPPSVQGGLLGVNAFLLGTYAALFAQKYWIV
jgi:hypothetical protein